MSKQPDKEKITVSSDRDLNKNVHFLDYSANSIAESWSQSFSDESNGFVPNRANITAATWDCAYFQDFFSQVVDRKKSHHLVIPVETAPFFHDYISAIQAYPEWKTLGQQDFPPELMENLLQSAYTSIHNSPEQLSYYEKVLCQTEEYCSFAASKLWAEELDYRYALLKDLLSHHSGQNQLENLAHLLRTFDALIIALTDSDPGKSENTGTQFLQNVPLKLYQQVRQNNRHPDESATNFLLRQEFVPIPFEEGRKSEDPLSDTEPFEIIDASKVFSLSKVNKVVRNKRFYDKTTRHQITAHARRIYLSSLNSKITSSDFLNTYNNLRTYLKPVDKIHDIVSLKEHAKKIVIPYYHHIWTTGSNLQYNPAINQFSNMTNVMLDALAEITTTSFINNFKLDLVQFTFTKEHLASPLYSHIHMHPYFPESPELLEKFIHCLSQYLGDKFYEQFYTQIPDYKSRSLHEIVLYILDLLKTAQKTLEITVTPQIFVCYSLHRDIITLFEQYPNNLTSEVFRFRQYSFSTPILQYVLVTLKIYYNCLNDINLIAEAFLQYHSVIDDYRKEFNKH